MLKQIKTQLDSIDEKGIEILAVAKDEFAKNGYHNANIQAIADKVGIGKGSVYRRFSSKQILFLSIIGYGYKNFYQEIEIIDKSKGFKTIMEQFMAKMVDFIYGNTNIMILAHMEHLNIFTGIQKEMFQWGEKMIAPMISFWEDVISNGKKNNSLCSNIDSANVSRMLLPIFHAVFHSKIIYKRDLTKEELTKEGEILLDILLNGLLI